MTEKKCPRCGEATEKTVPLQMTPYGKMNRAVRDLAEWFEGQKSEYTLRMKVKIISSEGRETAMRGDVTIPFVPVNGMNICINAVLLELQDTVWGMDEGKFSSFSVIKCSSPGLDEIFADVFKEMGWQELAV